MPNNLYKLGARPLIPGLPIVPFSKILKAKAALPTIPKAYDSRTALMEKYGLPEWYDNMDGNDQNGNCVVVGLSKALRLQVVQQTGIMPVITTEDIVKWYYKLSGGLDSGLVPTIAASDLRKNGVVSDGKLRKIFAYALINHQDVSEVQTAIYLLLSAQLVFALPISAQLQMGMVWEVIEGDIAIPGSWGYHQVNTPKYENGYITCQTWGAEQKMTVEWFQKYCVAALALVPIECSEESVVNPIDIPSLVDQIDTLSNVPNEPKIFSIIPNKAQQGNFVPAVQITGSNFTVDSDFDFGEGIKISDQGMFNEHTFYVNLSIAKNAAPGVRPVTINTGLFAGNGAFGYIVNGFEVLELPKPPIMDIIDNITVNIGEPVTFQVNAKSTQNLPLVYACARPAGASFDYETNTFYWIPEKAGTYRIHIIVAVDNDDDSQTSDLSVFQNVYITVLPRPNLIRRIWSKLFRSLHG